MIVCNVWGASAAAKASAFVKTTADGMAGQMGALFFDILQDGEGTGLARAWRIKLRQERPLGRARRRKKS